MGDAWGLGPVTPAVVLASTLEPGSASVAFDPGEEVHPAINAAIAVRRARRANVVFVLLRVIHLTTLTRSTRRSTIRRPS
jgi:hypothetical protein